MNNGAKWLAVEIEDWSEIEYMLVANNITEWNEWRSGMHNGKKILVFFSIQRFHSTGKKNMKCTKLLTFLYFVESALV